MRTLALLAITGYQRYLSPHKGFSCAYREWTGACSCSALGKRVIRRYGVRAGIGLLRQRFDRCAAAAIRLRTRRSEAGFIDCACDIPTCDIPGCDLPSCNLPSGSCANGLSQLASCGDCGGGGCGDRKRDSRRDEPLREVYLPPGKWEGEKGAGGQTTGPRDAARAETMRRHPLPPAEP